MLTRAQLLQRHCRRIDGPPLTAVQISEQLRALSDWRLVDGSLSRTYGFDDYFETLAFVNALAYMIHREDHHPDLVVGYKRCEVRFNTHSVAGISENDFICAAKADAIFGQHFGAGDA